MSFFLYTFRLYRHLDIFLSMLLFHILSRDIAPNNSDKHFRHNFSIFFPVWRIASLVVSVPPNQKKQQLFEIAPLH